MENINIFSTFSSLTLSRVKGVRKQGQHKNARIGGQEMSPTDLLGVLEKQSMSVDCAINDLPVLRFKRARMEGLLAGPKHAADPKGRHP